MKKQTMKKQTMKKQTIDPYIIVDVDFGTVTTEPGVQVAGHLMVRLQLDDPYLDDDGVHEPPNLYDVYVNGEIKHHTCTAEDVIRAMGHYIQSQTHFIQRLKA